MKTGIELIAEERQDQLNAHRFTLSKDKEINTDGELMHAAEYSLSMDRVAYPDKWDTWFMNKMEEKEESMNPIEFKIHQLKVAGALCAAEIDRLQSLTPAKDGMKEG